MPVHRRVTPSIKFAGTHLYTWVERGIVRVKCLAQEHNTMSPARARTRTARPETSALTMRPPRLPHGKLQWGTKGQLTRCVFLSPVSPRPPSNVLVCAGLYTLACPQSVSSSQHCLEGGGRAILGIAVFREVHIMIHQII